MATTRPLILLGPQRYEPSIDAAVEPFLQPGQAVAAVTAGWEEREAEDLELGEHVRQEVLNLQLYRRVDDVLAKDTELAAALRARRDDLRMLERLYRLRLRHLGRAAEQLLQRRGARELVEPECEDAFAQLRALDAHRLERVVALNTLFEARWQPQARPAVARHCEELRALLSRASVLCIAGGHVGVLYNTMWLFDLPQLLPAALPVVAWSAGAMVLAERIVLFHDSPPQGRGYAEVWSPGFGLAPGIVPLPHATRRLQLDDPLRVQMLSRRFPGALCAALDQDTRLEWDGASWSASPGTQELSQAGVVAPIAGRR